MPSRRGRDAILALSQGIADPKDLAIVGWTYAALLSAATSPELFKAVIAIAPVADLGRLKQELSGWSNHRLQHVPSARISRKARQHGGRADDHAVMMFHGSYDRNVAVGQSALMADRLKSAGRAGRLVAYDELDHYLEDSAARQDIAGAIRVLPRRVARSR